MFLKSRLKNEKKKSSYYDTETILSDEFQIHNKMLSSEDENSFLKKLAERLNEDGYTYNDDAIYDVLELTLDCLNYEAYYTLELRHKLRAEMKNIANRVFIEE